jgi:hypothetical protein
MNIKHLISLLRLPALCVGALCSLWLMLGLTSCTTLEYSNAKTGTAFKSTSLGTKKAISALKVGVDKDGNPTVDLKGYSNDQLETAAAVAAAVAGALAPTR